MKLLAWDQITVKKIDTAFCEGKNIELSVLRLDKIHPVVSGNKWFKLKYYIADALAQQKKTVVTYGGTWSNHIVATAYACKENNLQAVGIIRGERPPVFSQTLHTAQDYGMQFHFISRESFRQKILPPELLHSSKQDEMYFIDEGGYGEMGAAGAGTITDLVNKEAYSHICCAVGTGTMMAGLVNASLQGQRVTGISVLKNHPELKASVKQLLTGNNVNKEFHIIDDFHFGGYAKYTSELIDFMNQFHEATQIPSDFVYTGKLFFAVCDLVKNHFFENGSRLLLIHSGGLQGNGSLPNGTLIF